MFVKPEGRQSSWDYRLFVKPEGKIVQLEKGVGVGWRGDELQNAVLA